MLKGLCESCRFDYNVRFHVKVPYVHYSMGHVWFQY
jgi:hypothetical protein